MSSSALCREPSLAMVFLLTAASFAGAVAPASEPGGSPITLAMPSAPPVIMPPASARRAAVDRSDAVWAWDISDPGSLPNLWTEAPFVGNGMVGAYVMTAGGGQQLRIEVSRADYWDVRLPNTTHSVDAMYADTPRLTAGYFTVTPPPNVTVSAGSARMHLYNASASLSLVTNSGLFDLQMVALADRPGILLFTGRIMSEMNVTWVPRKAQASRGSSSKGYVPNPDATCASPPGLAFVCDQPLLAGGGFAAAAKIDGQVMTLSLANSVPAGIATTVRRRLPAPLACLSAPFA